MPSALFRQFLKIMFLNKTARALPYGYDCVQFSFISFCLHSYNEGQTGNIFITARFISFVLVLLTSDYQLLRKKQIMLSLREALTLEIQGYNKVDSERDP